MRVALINEATYPYVTGGVSTWCDQLVRGLSEVGWHLVTIVATTPGDPVIALPGNVESLNPVPVWEDPRATRHRAVPAAVRLCRGMLGDSERHLAMYGTGLRELVESAMPHLAVPHRTLAAGRLRRPADRPGRHPLAGIPLADILLDTWVTAGRTQQLPRLTLREADEAAGLIEHAVRPLAAAVPAVDLCHANANGLSSLVAMATKWRRGTPFIMTEHGVYLRERYLAAGDSSPGVKAAMLRFHRALARLAYAEADLIAPVSGFNQRWEVRHGADPAKVVVIPNGVDPQRFQPLSTEPDTPTIAWVGRVDPLKDLETLIRALARVRESVPDARLHLAGPVPPGNEGYAEVCRALVGELGLSAAVTFAGPVSSSRLAFEAGHVVALSSISEGMPYTVVEAMMCGRATVSTDVGGVSEMVGDTGIVVPPRNPEAFAAACVGLLQDARQRQTLAEAGRDRALRQYTLDRCVTAYRERYADLVRSRTLVSA
jgi:glycosyltransferase involved in cell wall biosynthesis